MRFLMPLSRTRAWLIGASPGDVALMTLKTIRATIEKGLLIVNTGTGKGKSTAAFGMAVLGHGMQRGVEF
jgi:hypothetical protein